MIIFNEAKPKYGHLDAILEDQLQNIRFSNQVNMIIDIKDIARKFFRPDIDPGSQSQSALIQEISSDTVNVISHYRNYLYKKGKYSTFYLLYSFGQCDDMKALYPDYKKEYYAKHLNGDDPKAVIVRKAMEVTQLTTQAVPHAYFIDTTKYDELIYARYILSMTKDNELNVILSNDEMMAQLLNDHTVMLTMKGIRSEVMTAKDCISKMNKSDEFTLSSHSIPLILAISGDKRYSISSLPHFAMMKATRMVQKLVDDGKAVDADSISLPIDATKLNMRNKMDRKIADNIEMLKSNYSLIRCDDLYYKNKESIRSDLVFHKKSRTLQDLKHLNEKFFTMYPIQLQMIMKGELK